MPLINGNTFLFIQYLLDSLWPNASDLRQHKSMKILIPDHQCILSKTESIHSITISIQYDNKTFEVWQSIDNIKHSFTVRLSSVHLLLQICSLGMAMSSFQNRLCIVDNNFANMDDSEHRKYPLVSSL